MHQTTDHDLSNSVCGALALDLVPPEPAAAVHVQPTAAPKHVSISDDAERILLVTGPDGLTLFIDACRAAGVGVDAAWNAVAVHTDPGHTPARVIRPATPVRAVWIDRARAVAYAVTPSQTFTLDLNRGDRIVRAAAQEHSPSPAAVRFPGIDESPPRCISENRIEDFFAKTDEAIKDSQFPGNASKAPTPANSIHAQ